MKRILTTHVGSLPILESVEAVVARQREIGLDLINEGEYTKGGDWLSYAEERFGGFEPRPAPPGERPLIAQGKDREAFADFYRYATERGTLFYTPGEQIKRTRPLWFCTEPVTYRGLPALRREIDTLLKFAAPAEAFLTSTAPGSLEVYRRNDYYRSEEEFVYAIAEAMRVEYEAIVASGVILQVDDAWLPALWDRIGLAMGLPAFLKYCSVRIEALNHALRNVPEEQVRYHLCWGSWHGPHKHDIPLADLVDVMLAVKAQAYLFEAANARHEHEYTLWERVKLPEGKILAPGVVTHATAIVEHPELVSQRIQRFARLVGRENVIASTDCGLGLRCHPQIAWAKLAALSEGAALASKALGFGH
jgi:5-methyltetrahydropteroyltriglutamate--homocysteine methyltransferase